MFCVLVWRKSPLAIARSMVTGESVQSEVRGVLGTKRKDIRIVGKTGVAFVSGKVDSLFLVTDFEGKNEQDHLLAKGVRPCAGHWLCGWLNERLLRKS